MHPLTLRLNAFLRDDLRQEGRVALHEPLFDGREWEYVKECLDTGWVSTVGAFVTRFEKDFAAFTGAKHAIVAVNGTAALHMALYGAGVRPGDLVICPTLTFVATANAIAHCGATPLFIDSDPETLGLSVPALRETLTRLKPGADGPTLDGRRVGACVPVHIFGHAADIEEIAALCSAHGITMIEDATEGLGANKGGVALGRFGLS
ncbi:MAG TPA: aminotransferase class I/II-fold pyridoxal phosphate-dependent enzyme, partial [Rhabdaerophilum sp.]|nr:aminotransferase class I/II-fold pyridoxal phosphate-dependent enzyme [Rhabdaerophilum sp.]